MMNISTVKLDGVVAEYVAAVNAFDEDAVVATLAEDALVKDVRREFWGKDAISRWVRAEVLGEVVDSPLGWRGDRRRLRHGRTSRRDRPSRTDDPARPLRRRV